MRRLRTQGGAHAERTRISGRRSGRCSTSDDAFALGETRDGRECAPPAPGVFDTWRHRPSSRRVRSMTSFRSVATLPGQRTRQMRERTPRLPTMPLLPRTQGPWVSSLMRTTRRGTLQTRCLWQLAVLTLCCPHIRSRYGLRRGSAPPTRERGRKNGPRRHRGSGPALAQSDGCFESVASGPERFIHSAYIAIFARSESALVVRVGRGPDGGPSVGNRSLGRRVARQEDPYRDPRRARHSGSPSQEA